MKKVTLKDISEQSGYSLVTVHRAINNKEGVSPEVREEILKLAERMGYTTNYIASALRRRQVNVAIVMPRDVNKQYFHYIWEGYRAYAATISQYNLNILEYTYTLNNADEQLEVLNTLYYTKGHMLDGLLVTPEENSTSIECIINKFCGKGIAVVLADNDFKDSGRLCCIAPNDEYTGRLAAEFMNFALSEKKGTVLVVKGSDASLSHEYNIRGFANYLKEHKSGLDVLCIDGTESLAKIKDEIKKVLQERKDIIAAYSVRARNTIPICEAAVESGRANELFIVGSDLFLESSEMLKKGILKVVVYKNPYQKGYTAFMTLFEHLIKGVDPKKDVLYVPISLILQNNIKFYEDFI